MANTKVTSRVLADNAVLTANIADDQVTTAKIADDVALGGNPTTTTQTAGNNTTRIATTAFVSTAVSNLVDSSPSALNTLNELAAALGDDANFSTTITNSIATKLPLAGGTMTGNIIMGDDTSIGIADDAERIEFDGAGDISLLGANVGIGTTSPSQQLETTGNIFINAASGNPDITIKTAGTGNNPAVVYRAGDNVVFDNMLVASASTDYWRVAYGSSGSITDELLAVTSAGDVGIGTTSPRGVLDLGSGSGDGTLDNTPANYQLILEAAQSTTGDIGRNIAFVNSTNDVSAAINSVDGGAGLTQDLMFAVAASGTLSEIMRLDAAGKVGIGTTSPSGKLDVVDSGVMDINLVGNPPEFNLEDSGGTSGQKRARITVNTQQLNIQGLSDDDTAITQQFITCDLSDGNVGIGTTNPAGTLHVQMTHTSTDVTAANSNETLVLGNAGTGNGVYNAIKFGGNQQDMYIMSFNNSAQADRRMGFFLGSVAGDAVADERLSIKGDGKVGIGTTSPSSLLHVDGSFSGTAVTIHNTAGASSNDRGLDVETSSTGTTVQRWINSGTEVARIVGNGDVLFNTTSIAELTKNAFTFDNSTGRVVITSNTGTEPMILNRQASDGTLIEFRQASSVEGTISVSGSTVSYNGFSGTHESSGISTDTAVGTVVSTIDELDTYSSGTKSGQARADHAKIKISDTVGDTRVYGVLNSYSQADNKAVIASVGIGSIKVTGACNGGDLLESNGDGTAKVQSDDIIKSKTIGKVTIGNSETGVKLVSCVLYCG